MRSVGISIYRHAINARFWLIMLWLSCATTGFVALANYHMTPGDDATLSMDHVDLAECPCTKASVDELANVLREVPEDQRPALQVLIRQPPQALKNRSVAIPWIETALNPLHPNWISDPNGEIAESFGMLTSGHVIVLQPDGSLLFSGGVTQSRGHRGDNSHAQSLSQVLNPQNNHEPSNSPLMQSSPDQISLSQTYTQDSSTIYRTPVFGCPIQTPNQNGTDPDQ